VISFQTQVGITGIWVSTGPGHTGAGIRCIGRVSISCWPVTAVVNPVSQWCMQSYLLSKSACEERSNYRYETCDANVKSKVCKRIIYMYCCYDLGSCELFFYLIKFTNYQYLFWCFRYSHCLDIPDKYIYKNLRLKSNLHYLQHLSRCTWIYDNRFDLRRLFPQLCFVQYALWKL
jgi:hypothetical protein